VEGDVGVGVGLGLLARREGLPGVPHQPGELLFFVGQLLDRCERDLLGRQGVAFEVDGYDAEHGEAWSVVLKGRAAELERMQDVFDACDLPLFPWLASPKPRFVRIEPDSVTGRRFNVVDRTAAGVPTTGAHRRAPA
jgi:hypothetical protein